VERDESHRISENMGTEGFRGSEVTTKLVGNFKAHDGNSPMSPPLRISPLLLLF